MKPIKILFLLIFIFSLYQVNLFSLITSRIKGNVVDKDTGEPIIDADVSLYLIEDDEKRFTYYTWRTKTDKNGDFKFEIKSNVFRPGTKFYVQCHKKGYIGFHPKHYYRSVREELFNEIFKTFNLKQGQIKHLKIELEKGGIIEGTLYAKNIDGIKPLKIGGMIFIENDKIHPFFYDAPYYATARIDSDDNGKFRTEGIEPYDNYNITCHFGGYPSKTIKNISIKKNEVTHLEHTFDFTDHTGVKGVVSIVNIEGKTLLNGSVSMIRIEDIEQRHIKCTYNFRKDGKYHCLGLSPGVYIMEVYASTEDLKQYEKELKIEIEQGKTKVLNINF